jgi:hypothetical protein
LFITVYMVLFAAHLHCGLKITCKGRDAVQAPRPRRSCSPPPV